MKDVPAARGLRVEVVLIHHDVPDRVAAAMPTVDLVAEAMSAFGQVTVRQVSSQPEYAPVGAAELTSRRIRQWWTERRWAGYLGVGRRWVLSTGLLALRLAALVRPSVRRTAARQAFIELALSAKHELAWRTAHECGTDLLVVLEDDARARAGSLPRIRQLVEQASDEGRLQDAYIDLAGGLAVEALRLSDVREDLGDGIVRLTRPATNTTCGYLLGRDVLARLAETTVRDPATTRLPADWLMNAVFAASSSDGSEPSVYCLHSQPHALDHGSFTGAVSSSIRE